MRTLLLLSPALVATWLRRYLVNLSSKMVRTCVVMLVAVIFTGPAIDALKLPTYLAPCSRNDPNLDECSLKSALAGASSLFKGDRTYNIPALDPLRITKIKIEDTSADSTGLDITFNDLDVHGLSEAKIVKAKFDLKNKKINIDLTVETLMIKSKYVIDGKILILPIKGNGDCSLNLTNADIKVNLDYELVNKGDKEHMSVTGSKLDFDLGKLDIYFDNLFNGDKALGETLVPIAISIPGSRTALKLHSHVCRKWKAESASVSQRFTRSANEAVCFLMAAERMRCQTRMRTDLRRLVLRFDWLSRAEHLRQSGQSRDELNFSGTARADEAEILRMAYSSSRDSTNKFLNENWEVLAKDLGPFVAEGIAAAIKQIATGLMDKVPYEDFFPVSV
uniref:Uncharacterized protein n=1 Tax=Timema bartmani TaxID=61472 RepID=A0A7R9F724_9NEOP|nr:unnamed protein product [Timema bartmani]